MASVSDFRLSGHAQLRISFSTIGRDDLAQAATSQVERRGRNMRHALCDPPEVLTACQPGTFDRDLVVDFCFRASLVGKDICVAPGGQPLRVYTVALYLNAHPQSTGT